VLVSLQQGVKYQLILPYYGHGYFRTILILGYNNLIKWAQTPNLFDEANFVIGYGF